MSTYKDIVYAILDEIKSNSDDSFYTEDYVIFLAGKVRTMLLKQRYSDVRKEIPDSNYQTICLDLIEVPAISGEPCEGGYYLRSKEKIPHTMDISTPKIYPIDYYQGNITYISMERMKYVGHNKYLQNIIYASIGPDDYLYLKSSNPQYLYLEKVKMSAVFEDIQVSSELQCEGEDCDIMDREFPLESGLVPTLTEIIIKRLLGASYRPKDSENNASDDLSSLASFLQRNTKSDLSKLINNE